MEITSWIQAPGFPVVAIASLVAILGGLMMVTRRDVVRGALWLVVTLIAVAVLYVTLSADLIAMVQIVVYAGAIIVLFLFVILLLAAGKEPEALRNSGVGGWTGLLVALAMLALLLFAAVEHPLAYETQGVLATAEAATGGTFGSAYALGAAMFSAPNVLTLELISVLLVTAMIGVIVMAKGLRAAPNAEPTGAEDLE